jgi:hypothetical protein
MLGGSSGIVAVEFDPLTMGLFVALVGVTVVSPFVSLVVALRRGMRAGIYCALGITLAIALAFVALTLGDDRYSWDMAIFAFAFILLPNVTLALVGTGVSTIRRRRGGHSFM